MNNTIVVCKCVARAYLRAGVEAARGVGRGGREYLAESVQAVRNEKTGEAKAKMAAASAIAPFQVVNYYLQLRQLAKGNQ